MNDNWSVAAQFIPITLVALAAIFPARMAARKGRSFWGYWLFTTLCFPVGLAVVLLIGPSPEGIVLRVKRRGSKNCPSCAERIRAEARVCRYCSRGVVERQEPWL